MNNHPPIFPVCLKCTVFLATHLVDMELTGPQEKRSKPDAESSFPKLAELTMLWHEYWYSEQSYGTIVMTL